MVAMAKMATQKKNSLNLMGVGLRGPYLSLFLDGNVKSVSWVEVITENYLPWKQNLVLKSTQNLEKVRANYEVHLHGVSLSLGSSDPLDLNYLKQLKTLKERINARLVSDHLCWSQIDGRHLHDLLPLPHTKEAIELVSENILRVQDYLKTTIAVENVSSYIQFAGDEMPEWEFVSDVVKNTGCQILLDINNVYVNSVNHGFDPRQYLSSLPLESVAQIHLAGHTVKNGFLIDTHDQPICEDVWALYKDFCLPVPTMIERDARFPDWSEIEQEIKAASRILRAKKTKGECVETPAIAARI